MQWKIDNDFIANVYWTINRKFETATGFISIQLLKMHFSNG